MTYLVVVVVDWLRINGKRCELANLSLVLENGDWLCWCKLRVYIFLRLSGDFSLKNMLKGTLKFKFRYNTEKINKKCHVSYQS